MAGVVPDVLVWELIKNHNSGLVKRNHEHFSRERFNLLNKHSFKHSGFAHRHAIDIQDNSDPKKPKQSNVGLTVKDSRTAKPGKQVFKNVTNPSSRKGAAAVRLAVKQSGRPVLLKEALARFSRIKKCQGPRPAAGVKKPRHPRQTEKAKNRKDPHLV